MDFEPSHRPRLHRASSDRTTARRLQRMAANGDLRRMSPGVYVRPDEWDALDPRGRHLLLIQAVAPRLPHDVALSHLSAAAVRGLAHVGRWPERVQVSPRGGARHEIAGVSVRRTLMPRIESGTASDRFLGVPVADLVETALGAALDAPFAAGVVLLDDALRRGVDRAAVASAADRLVSRGRVHVERVLAASDVRHESVGESYCAARLVELGFDEVEPQHVFRLEDGSTARVDFWMPSLGVVVEFDGRQKCEDASMLHGRSGADAVWAEKLREDRLRALPEVRGFVRVTWWHLVDPERLDALFRQHGVRPRRAGGAGQGSVL